MDMYSFELSGCEIIKDNLVVRASFAFFHLITKAPSSGQELITRSLQRLSLSFEICSSLRSSLLEIAFPPSIVPLSQSMHNFQSRHMHKLALSQSKNNQAPIVEKVDRAIKQLNQYHA